MLEYKSVKKTKQNRSRVTDVENKLMVTKGESWGWGGINLEFGINIYTLLYIK